VTARRVRIGYYGAVGAVALLAHLDGLSEITGSAAASFLRRNSEAYVLMLAVPLYWDVISGRGRVRQVAWYVFLVVGSIVTQAGAVDAAWAGGVPGSIVTLGEAFVAAIVLSAYFDISRSSRWDSGLVPAVWRVMFYVLALVLTVVVHQDAVLSRVGDTLGEILAINTEAYAAILLIPIYFDFVAPTVAKGALAVEADHVAVLWGRVLWYGALFVVPLVAAAGLGEALDPVTHWLTLTTEVFLAAIVISLYFDVMRLTGIK
jgi:hypothetical protein